MGEGATEDKTTLAQKDIRFARTIQRLQRVIIAELEKIGIIHLFTLGFRGDDLLSFKLSLNNPSKIAELQELEHWKQKFDVAGAATEGFFSKRWIAEHMFGMSADEFIRNQREMFHDKKFAAALDAAVAEESEKPSSGGGGLGDLDLGGDTDDALGDIDLGGDAGDETPADEPATPAAADEEPTLLAEPPAKRSDDAKPRGPYKRHQTSYDKGGRTKNYKNVATGGEIRGSTERTTFPGKTGYGGLDSLTKGMFEIKKQNEDLEEEKLFTISKDVRQLLHSLIREDKHETQ
jgi:hypothetical protein